jgi:hypothetical protein
MSSSSILEREFAGVKVKAVLALGLLAALALAGFVAWGAAHNGGAGFPLDDAWIHQAYARTLVTNGEWGLAPGQPSAGATSVLWVLLLAPGAVFGLAPFTWVWLLGWLTLWATGLLGSLAVGRLSLKHATAAPWAGALLIVEFHLVWAAASGMETALFATLCLAAMVLSLQAQLSPRGWLGVGALVGAAVLARPEGLTLLGPLAIALWASEQKARVKNATALVFGCLLPVVPYLLFNLNTSGQFWPNTLYAKQAEYAVLLAQPLWARLAQQWAQPLIGVGLFLLPGFALTLVSAWRGREWRVLAWAVWALGFLSLFALRLPVVYQHGRYAMPVLPVYAVLAFAGALSWLRPRAAGAWRRRASLAWAAALPLATLLFYGLGAQAYQRDVAFIDSQMVATAEWVRANTPADARVAAHDIGALGYFAGRPLIDLAGLVSPEVIPFIRNEPRIADHLYAQAAQYLVIFPDWYPQLSTQAELLFQAPLVNGAPGMAVYGWVQLSP